MKLLFCGDVVGRSGREVITRFIPRLRKEHALDFVVVNGDNAAGGFGITPDVCKEFYAAGVDVITGGDHIWDQKDVIPYLATEKRLLRPLNFPEKTPGAGYGIYTSQTGKKLMVIHLLGQVFHKEHTNCPFLLAEKTIEQVRMGQHVAGILIDFHAEATSEKTAMGQFMDGRASVVVGSHTHVPTGDARVLPKGTAYQTDAGMCGDYNTVIGFKPEGPLERFLTKIPKARMEPGAGEGTLCGLLVDIDEASGRATQCAAFQYPAPLGA